VRTTDFRTALLASLPAFPEDAPLAWAAVSGAVSVVGLRWDWIAAARMAAAVLLAAFVIRWISGLVAGGRWAIAPNPDSQTQAAPLPYALAESPARRAFQWGTRVRRAWQKHKAWPQTALFFAATGLLLAVGLGRPGVWFGAGGLAAAGLVGLWRRRHPVAAGNWAPLLLTALAWTLGATAVGGGADWNLAAAPCFGAAASGLAVLRRREKWWRALLWAGLTAPAALLIARQMVLPAVAVLFLAAPACVLAPTAEESPDDYARAVRWLLWLSMAVTALTLGW